MRSIWGGIEFIQTNEIRFFVGKFSFFSVWDLEELQSARREQTVNSYSGAQLTDVNVEARGFGR